MKGCFITVAEMRLKSNQNDTKRLVSVDTANQYAQMLMEEENKNVI